MTAQLPRLEPLRHVSAGVLDVAYHEAGPADGTPVLLLHGFPYDVHSYVEVAPRLAGAGFRVVVPYLRGHGGTRFRERVTPRSGQQAALGQDVIDLMDALGIERAVLAGYDWGGRAACVAAALHPERVIGLVSVNGYLIQDISASMHPLPPQLESGFWYFFYFLTERGRRAAVPAGRGAPGRPAADQGARGHARRARRRQLPGDGCRGIRSALHRAARASPRAARRSPPAAGGAGGVRRGGRRGARARRGATARRCGRLSRGRRRPAITRPRPRRAAGAIR